MGVFSESSSLLAPYFILNPSEQYRKKQTGPFIYAWAVIKQRKEEILPHVRDLCVQYDNVGNPVQVLPIPEDKLKHIAISNEENLALAILKSYLILDKLDEAGLHLNTKCLIFNMLELFADLLTFGLVRVSEKKIYENSAFRDSDRDDLKKIKRVLLEFTESNTVQKTPEQMWQEEAKKLLHKWNNDKDVVVFILVRKFGKNGTEKRKPYLQVTKAGVFVGIPGYPSSKEDKNGWSNYRSKVNQARKRGKNKIAVHKV